MLLCPMCITEHLSILKFICHLLAGIDEVPAIDNECSGHHHGDFFFVIIWEIIMSLLNIRLVLIHSFVKCTSVSDIKLNVNDGAMLI